VRRGVAKLLDVDVDELAGQRRSYRLGGSGGSSRERLPSPIRFRHMWASTEAATR